MSREKCGHMIAPMCGCKPAAPPPPASNEPDPDKAVRVADLLTVQAKIKRRKMRDNLAFFFKEAWGALNGGTPLEWGPHIQAVCDHVQAQLEDRARAKDDWNFKMRAQNLVINVPPRSLKTKILTYATIWAWLRWPEMRIMYLSANPRVAWNSARDARDLIISNWFQKTFEPEWTIRSDQNALTDLGNTAGGARISRGLGGAITGEGAEWIIVDDPHDLRDSIENIEKCIEGYDSAVHNRINNPRASIRTCIMQRVNIADFTAHVLKKGWRHLCIPMEFEGKRFCTCGDCQRGTSPYGWKDTRTREGERLHPRFSEEFLEGERMRLGPFGYACTPAETPILMGDWTEKRVSDVRPGDTVVGFTLGTPEERARLVPAVVKNVFQYEAEVFELIMESGRRVRCTADHKWFMKKRDASARPNYLPATPGRSRLALVAEPLGEMPTDQAGLWGYLAGMLDGEGCIKHGRSIVISQSPGANPHVFARIGEVLDRLGIKYSVHRQPAKKTGWSEKGWYVLHDVSKVGRSLLSWTDLGKANQLRDMLYRRGGTFVKERDKVLRAESLGVQPVYALETETGNYIAWGYASSNSQMQQRPSVAGGGRIKKEWFGFFRLSGHHAGDHERPPGCNNSPARLVEKVIGGWNHGKWDLDWSVITVDAANKKPCYVGGMILVQGRGLIPLKDVRVGDQILTHKGRYRKVLDITHQGELPLVEFVTARGRRVKVANSHPMLTQRGWVRADEVNTNDVLAEVHPQEMCEGNDLSKEEARLLGYLIGDGCLRENGHISFTNIDPDTLDDFEHCARTVGFLPSERYTAPGRRTVDIRLMNGEKNLKEWLKGHGLHGASSYTKRVPGRVLGAGDDVVADFLAAYWACDGGLYDRRQKGDPHTNGYKVSVLASTVSPGLAQDLQHVLTRLGMSFTVRKSVVKKKTKRQGDLYTSWLVSASDQDVAAKFVQNISPRMRHEKRMRANDLQRNAFDQVLRPDAVKEIVTGSTGECMCLEVEEDHSFSYQGVGVHNTERGSAYGLLAVGGKDMRRFVLDDRTQRGEFTDILEVLRDMIITWRPDKVLVEAKAAGPSLMSSLQADMQDGKIRAHDFDVKGNDSECRGRVICEESENSKLWKCSKCKEETNGSPIICAVEPIEVDMDKERRVDAVLPQFAARLVYILEGALWNAEFVEEHALFPESPWNDRVDALSQVLEYYKDGPFYVL